MTVGGKPLRAGIIGCGGIAQEGHIPSLLAAGVEIGALCDTNESRAQEVGEKLGVTAVYTDYEQLLTRSDLDLVTIALPNLLHAPAAIAALAAGKHVLCEKPMSVDSAGAAAMVKASHESGKLLSINQHMRFDRTTLAMCEAVASGALGDVYLTDVRLTRQNGIPGYGSWFTNRDLAGRGALFDIGVHMLDLALYVLGFPEVQKQVELLDEELVVVGEVVAEERERLDERAASGHDLGAAAREQVEGGELLEHAHRIVRAEHADRACDPNTRRPLGDRSERERRRGDGEVGAMVLADTEDVEPDLVRERRLLDQVAQALRGRDRPVAGSGVSSAKV